jgi:TonB family protein
MSGQLSDKGLKTRMACAMFSVVIMAEPKKRIDGINSWSILAKQRSWSSYWRRAAIGAAALSVVLALGLPLSARPEESEAVEQLDVIAVSAARILPELRPLPLPMPDISTAPRLLPESLELRVAPEFSKSTVSRAPRLLLDDTASLRGYQTRVRYLEANRPTYPRRARELGWHGTVLLRLEVRTDGTVGDAFIHRTSGYTALDQAALGAAKAWRFAPQTDGAFAIPAIVDVPVRFDLTDQPQSER